jgi:hypothetical protein
MKLLYILQLNESGRWAKSETSQAEQQQQQLELDLAVLRNGDACTLNDFKEYLEYLGGLSMGSCCPMLQRPTSCTAD